MTQTYPNQQATTAPNVSRVASAARAASFKRGYRRSEVLGLNLMSGTTYQVLESGRFVGGGSSVRG